VVAYPDVRGKPMIRSNQPTTIPISEEKPSSHPGWWTVLAVIATAWLGIPMLLPVAAAIPWFFFRRRHAEQARHLAPTFRWALAVWVTAGAMVSLAGATAARSIPFGAQSAAAARAWLDSSGGAVPSLVEMTAWFLLFVGTTMASRGFLGSIVLAQALLVTAVHAAVVFAQSWNLAHACAVALPIWSALLLVGMILLLDPLAAWGESRFARSDAPRVVSRKALVTGAALVAGALMTRLALAGPITHLVRQVTLP